MAADSNDKMIKLLTSAKTLTHKRLQIVEDRKYVTKIINHYRSVHKITVQNIFNLLILAFFLLAL